MIESQAWEWEIIDGEKEKIWKNPSMESYYLVDRWKNQKKKHMLDLGCGIGRHTILFASNGFEVEAFDLSENAVNRTKEWTEQLGLNVNCKIGDMLKLPYEDETIDCIFCKNVISHTDTNGVKQIIKEINRVLKNDGECYLTLCSKQTWGAKQEDWPIVDEHTKIRIEDGPENGVPHFFADYELIKELFKENKIEKVLHIEDFYDDGGEVFSSYHYHVLIRKDIQ